jgi:hypothetical protein
MFGPLATGFLRPDERHGTVLVGVLPPSESTEMRPDSRPVPTNGSPRLQSAARANRSRKAPPVAETSALPARRPRGCGFERPTARPDRSLPGASVAGHAPPCGPHSTNSGDWPDPTRRHARSLLVWRPRRDVPMPHWRGPNNPRRQSRAPRGSKPPIHPAGAVKRALLATGKTSLRSHYPSDHAATQCSPEPNDCQSGGENHPLAPPISLHFHDSIRLPAGEDQRGEPYHRKRVRHSNRKRRRHRAQRGHVSGCEQLGKIKGPEIRTDFWTPANKRARPSPLQWPRTTSISPCR